MVILGRLLANKITIMARYNVCQFQTRKALTAVIFRIKHNKLVLLDTNIIPEMF